MDHVVSRKLEELTGTAKAPQIGYAVETRDRPGPAHKNGAFPNDGVWIQLRGGLIVAKARIQLCWSGEYSHIGEVRNRTRGSALHDMTSFWSGRRAMATQRSPHSHMRRGSSRTGPGRAPTATSGCCWTTTRSAQAGWTRSPRRAPRTTS
jgi:hypothetical protein